MLPSSGTSPHLSSVPLPPDRKEKSAAVFSGPVILCTGSSDEPLWTERETEDSLSDRRFTIAKFGLASSSPPAGALLGFGFLSTCKDSTADMRFCIGSAHIPMVHMADARLKLEKINYLVILQQQIATSRSHQRTQPCHSLWLQPMDRSFEH